MLLGGMQVMTGDMTAATAAVEQALELFSDLGGRVGQGDAINSLG